MTQTKHLIFGAGLIGSYLAGCFMRRDAHVSLVKRESAINAFQTGFKLSDFENNKYKLDLSPAFVSINDNLTFDVIWLTVKCHSVNQVISDLRVFINPSTVIVCCQNGFGSEQLVIDAFPNNETLCAVVGFNVAQLDNGHWHRSTDGAFVIQKSITENSRGINSINEQLASELLPIKLSADIHAERWAKLQLNLANAVNALADIPIKQMLELRAYRLIIASLMHELLMVTDAQQITLPKVSAVHGKAIPLLMRLPNFIFKRIAQKMLAIDPLARTSMWHDLSQQRLTEIDFINGAVSNTGKQLNIKTPVNDALIALIKSVECGDESIGISPHELQHRLGF